MENKNSFKMTYSAEQQAEIENIRKKYIPKEEKEDKMARIRTLDARAEGRASEISIIFGIIGMLVLGTGMSLIMSDFGKILGDAALSVGIIAGIAGIAMVVLAYPLYNRTLKKEREKIAPEILRLTDELMK